MSHQKAKGDYSCYRVALSPENLEGAERHTLTRKEHAQIQHRIRFHWLHSFADILQAALTKPIRDIEAELQESADRIEKLESLSPDKASFKDG